MAPRTIDQFPEELLERILVHALPSAPDARPLWLRSPAHPSTRLAPLLTSRQLTRIATPLLYHSVHLPTPDKARLLLRTLRADPSLAAHIRCLSLAGVWRDAAEVMTLCSSALHVLDLSISFEGDEEHCAQTDDLYGEALKGLTGIRHMTLRKPNNVYLSLPRPRAIINAVGLAIPSWPNLRTAHIAFKLSDDTPTSPVASVPLPFSSFALPPASDASKPPSTPTTGPVSLLASSLASAPHLHTFTTHLPSVWNTSILSVSSNPRLERIVLSTPNTCARANACYNPHPACNNNNNNNKLMPTLTPQTLSQTQGIIGTGLFLMEARRHARLGELIRAGTPIMRTRAHTMGTPSPSPSPPPSSSSAVAAAAVSGAAGAGLQKRESGVGLGLKIDTSVVVVAAASGSASAGMRGPVSASAGNGKGKSSKGKGKGRWN